MSSISKKSKKSDDIRIGDGKPPFEIDVSEAAEKFRAGLKKKQGEKSASKAKRRNPSW